MTATKPLGNKLTTRRITICRKSFERCGGSAVPYPMLTLTGKWLQENGFKIGHVVDITCEKKKLIITIAEEQKYVDR